MIYIFLHYFLLKSSLMTMIHFQCLFNNYIVLFKELILNKKKLPLLHYNTNYSQYSKSRGISQFNLTNPLDLIRVRDLQTLLPTSLIYTRFLFSWCSSSQSSHSGWLARFKFQILITLYSYFIMHLYCVLTRKNLHARER